MVMAMAMNVSPHESLMKRLAKSCLHLRRFSNKGYHHQSIVNSNQINGCLMMVMEMAIVMVMVMAMLGDGDGDKRSGDGDGGSVPSGYSRHRFA